MCQEVVFSNNGVYRATSSKFPLWGDTVSHSCSAVSGSLRPHGLELARFLCPWSSPGKNTGVGGHFLLQGDLPNPGIELTSLTFPALTGVFFITEPPRMPRAT